MPTKYRSRTDIIAEILKSANGRQVTKTRMLYSTFLSHAQLKGYIAVMIQNGLLEYQKLTVTYRTTEKGIRFLDLYEKMEEIAAETELPYLKQLTNNPTAGDRV
ncbi:MAG: winged helix-turn-helix domain-containing protein [Thermoproteota archaeon]